MRVWQQPLPAIYNQLSEAELKVRIQLAREALGSCGRTPGLGVPDGFHYAISVDGRGVGHCAEPQLTESQRWLIALVMEQGQHVPRTPS